ncbi:MAG: sodium:glutamate symporter [Lachnospiraceae bacterium]|nr:sodium:glutamate symporter [Lachnospiraceae bacterium]
MMAFGWAGIMLCMGMFLRVKIPAFRKMLVPTGVIAGILGIIFMNVAMGADVDVGTDMEMFTSIVNHLFTVSFISISLTSTPQEEKGNAGNVLKGAVSMGLLWCLLYSMTPVIATGALYLMSSITDMSPGYGMLIQFAFCQGPGQSAAYGAIFEQYGWDYASTVAITFASIGFIVAFLIGIPAAKLGVKRGIAKHCGKIDEAILKGYFRKEEQTEYMVKDTTCSSNIETLAFHFALIGVCYVLAVGIGKILSYIPGFLGTSMSSMMFMNGMYAAYLVKWLMKKLHLDFLQENVLQSKITGWTADYLVVCAFMAVSVDMISRWLLPIFVVVLVTTAVTFAVSFYFGQRIGGANDFERTLGLYGTCTGTVPSGIALVRIIDPEFKTTTSVELGAMNLVMLASTPVYIFILAYASDSLSLSSTILALLGCAVVYLILLKATKSWGKKSYHWK